MAQDYPAHSAPHIGNQLLRRKERRNQGFAGTPAADARQPDNTEYRKPRHIDYQALLHRQRLRQRQSTHRNCRRPLQPQRGHCEHIHRQDQQGEGAPHILQRKPCAQQRKTQAHDEENQRAQQPVEDIQPEEICGVRLSRRPQPHPGTI